MAAIALAGTGKLAARAAKAAGRVADLQGQLRSALLDGEDTSDIRVFLQDAAQEVEKVAAAQAALIVEAELAAENRLHAATGAIAAAAANQLVEKLAALTLPSTLSETAMNIIAPHHASAIQAAAEQVAAAGVAHEDAVAELHGAEATSTTVAGRIAQKMSTRAAIVARRGGGDTWPSDGADLALIIADLENLQQELANADAEVAARRVPVRAAQSAVAVARAQLIDIEREAAEAALLVRAETLDALMLETVQKLDVARSGQPVRPKWGPSVELRTALRRVSAQRGEL